MASNFCENCGNTFSGNVCDSCERTVKTSKNDRHTMERHTGMNEKLAQNNYWLYGPEWVPDRNFTSWLRTILFIPFGQIIYVLEVMKDFKNYLWPRLQADSTPDLGSKEVKVRSPTFYVMILAVPTVIGYLYLLLLNLSVFYLVGLVEDDANSLSDISRDVLIILFILFVILPIVIGFISHMASTFYIYHKHIILSQFIDLRYRSNTHQSEYPVVKLPIFRVKQKALIYLGISCASLVSSVIAVVLLFTTFLSLATLIAGFITVLIYLTSRIIWLNYEKIWHNRMYNLIRFESSMERNHPRPA